MGCLELPHGKLKEYFVMSSEVGEQMRECSRALTSRFLAGHKRHGIFESNMGCLEPPCKGLKTREEKNHAKGSKGNPDYRGFGSERGSGWLWQPLPNMWVG